MFSFLVSIYLMQFIICYYYAILLVYKSGFNIARPFNCLYRTLILKNLYSSHFSVCLDLILLRFLSLHKSYYCKWDQELNSSISNVCECAGGSFKYLLKYNTVVEMWQYNRFFVLFRKISVSFASKKQRKYIKCVNDYAFYLHLFPKLGYPNKNC